MEYCYKGDLTDTKNAKLLIEHTFKNLKINNIEAIGNGHDSIAYLVNNEYIFKTKFSVNNKKGYAKENAIYDFLIKNLDTNVMIPNIEYSHISAKVSILGYKQINGKFLTPKLYESLSNEEKLLLKQDIAVFLKQMHSLDTTDIKEYVIDNKQNILEEYQLLRDTFYEHLTEKEKDYIEIFMNRLSTTTIFDDKKCLCHNDFSCNHLLLDENNRLCGIIDFGDAGIVDEYCDFMYLLEDSEEEIGPEFGEAILNIYGDINIDKAKEYQDVTEQYYPIELIVYGIKNNNQEFIDEGRQIIQERNNKNKNRKV